MNQTEPTKSEAPTRRYHSPADKVRILRLHLLEGHRGLTFMMLDRYVAAVSPATTYRVLKGAGVISSRPTKTSRKGRGFEQPLQPHEHWHVDFSHLNIGGTFYYLCSVLDGASRAILSWDIRPQMPETDAEIVIQCAREAHPQARPRLIIKEDAIRPKTPLTLEDAKRIVGGFIVHYNTVRLHSALGYITPADRLAARHHTIFAARDKKLETARENRKIKRQ
jgi:putative transposase